VTAELAVTFPVVVLALALVLFAGSVAQAGVTCVDAARAAGRVLARGEPAGAAATAAGQVAGRPVSVQVSSGSGGRSAGGPQGGGLVVVTVRVDAGPAPVPRWGDPAAWRLPVTCSARAWAEPTG
jgi:hypothetical protein